MRNVLVSLVVSCMCACTLYPGQDGPGATNTPADGGPSGHQGSGRGSGSASGSGSGSGGGGAATCEAGGVGGEFATCDTSADCACPFACVDDPYLSPVAGSKVCEQPCAQSADCHDLQTFCEQGACHLSPCGPNYGNADAACTTGDHQSGSCLTATDPGGDPTRWVWGCSLAGTSTGGCNPAQIPYRQDLTARCAPGLACDLFTEIDQCVQLCVPHVDVCPNGGYCIAQDSLGNIGHCE